VSPRVTWPSRLSPVPHTSGYNFTEATAHAQNTTLSPPNSNPNPNPDADQDTPAPQAVRPPPRAASPGSVLGLGPHVIARRPPVALCRIIIAFAPKGLCAANARSLARSIESLSCAGMVNTVKAPPAQPATRRSDLHCTCCGGALAPHACEVQVWTTPPHPRPRQEREARLAPSVLSSAMRTTSSTSPPPRGNARSYRGRTHVGAQARSAHAIGAERVARGCDGSERLRRPAQARSAVGAQRRRRAAPCAESRARSARRISSSPQAPGAQRPRHRRSARRPQLACWRGLCTRKGVQPWPWPESSFHWLAERTAVL